MPLAGLRKTAKGAGKPLGKGLGGRPSDDGGDSQQRWRTAALEEARSKLSLPFYLYEGPEFDNGSWFEPCARGLRGEKVHEDQYAGEHYFYEQLRSHRWRVSQPSAAVLFVVPLYANAALQPSVKGLACNGSHYQDLFDTTARTVEASPQYARHLGADHVIVSNSWRTATRAPKQAPWAPYQRSSTYFRHVFRHAIVGHMEARHANDDGWWRCSVVSPYVANFDEARQQHLVPIGSAERSSLFYFHGGANNRGTYGYAFRQAALAQLQELPSSHLSGIQLPGGSARCGAGLTTNCEGGRSTGGFRDRMARARFNLVLPGDSPSSRRLYDGFAAGALPVLVSDQIWSVGLPFQCLVPWRRLAFSVAEAAFETEGGALGALRRLSELQPSLLQRMQRLANHHRRDVLWNMNGSRVAENLLVTAALRCLPTFAVRHAARRDASLAASLSSLRAACAHQDTSVACRAPDDENCAGCETGEISAGTPTEHCCATACAACNRTGRCTSRHIFRGDPLLTSPGRRGQLESYLLQKDKDLPQVLQTWRQKVGRPDPARAAAERSKRKRGGVAAPRGKSRG